MSRWIVRALVSAVLAAILLKVVPFAAVTAALRRVSLWTWVTSLAIFLIGSVAAALAWNIWALIAARAIQGAGGAVFPLSFGIIRDEFPREKLGVAIGLVSAVFGIGGGFGMKTGLTPEDALVCYAARKLGRPVRWRADRAEDFLAAHMGRDQQHKARLALDGDGRI
ncbi:MAG: MFS transporter, partial [Thermoplasmatota archaeon]